MKKALSLILALIMALTCGFAAADTVSLKMKVNPNALGNAMTAMGLPEETLASLNPVISLLNALGVSVMTLEDGGEVRLDLNGKEWLSLGLGAGEEAMTVVSSLFPNYALNISTEALTNLLGTVMGAIGGGAESEAGEAGADNQQMAALMENLTTYSTKLIEAFTIAAVPGEPIPGEYEMEGIVFDTLTPVTVDIAAIAAAYGEFMEDLLHDEALMGMVQTSMQMSGQTFDEEEYRTAMDEMIAHFPDAVSAEVYSFSDGQPGSFVSSQAFYADRTDPSYAFTMIDKGDGIGTMAYYGYDQQMIIGVEYAPEGFRFDFTMGEMFFGMEVAAEENTTTCHYFCMDPATPVMTVTVTTSIDGVRSLPTEAGEKAIVTLEDLMNPESEGYAGVMGDLMMNGLGGLMEGLSEVAPDLMAMLMPSVEEDAAAPAGKQVIRLGSSVYTIQAPDHFVLGERRKEEIEDDMVAYYRSDVSDMDFDIYQFSKEGEPEILTEYAAKEAEKYQSLDLVEMEINGISAARYSAKETYDGVEYTTETYILEDGDQYVEIVFWLDGDTAWMEAQDIIQSLSFIPRGAEE